MEDILAKAGNKEVTVKTFANADHSMVATKTGGPSEIAATDRKKEFVPDYLSTITNWLAPRVRSTP
jgi:hypothetical protein